MTRLQRFRAFMARMNPIADPRMAITQRLTVDHPDGNVWAAIQEKLALEPVATHLVLGGIGSGKTTQLLLARDALQSPLGEVGDHVEYCDVSTQHHLDSPQQAGVIVALIGLRLLQADTTGLRGAPAPVISAANSLQRFAHGYTEWVDDLPEGEPSDYPDPEDEYPEPPQRPVHHPGVLQPPPKASLPWNLQQRANDLTTLLHHYPGEGKSALFFLDSLDRLPKPESFRTMIQHDIQLLKRAGIGVVVVGPVRFIPGNDRSIAELFDHTHFQLAVDPCQDAGLAFLVEILRRRAGGDHLLPESCLRTIALASGGILRDLLTLAKRAAEDAYAAGRDEVLDKDVAQAVDAMGRNLAIGLDDEQVKQLIKVRSTEKLVVRGDRELSLLETRRVILYKDNHCVVHPALAPLIGLIPEAQ